MCLYSLSFVHWAMQLYLLCQIVLCKCTPKWCARILLTFINEWLWSWWFRPIYEIFQNTLSKGIKWNCVAIVKVSTWIRKFTDKSKSTTVPGNTLNGCHLKSIRSFVLSTIHRNHLLLFIYSIAGAHALVSLEAKMKTILEYAINSTDLLQVWIV